MRIKIILILILFFVFCDRKNNVHNLDIEKKPYKTGIVKEPAKNNPKTTSKINRSWTFLPKHFQPHDPIYLYEKCCEISSELEKSEYETTEEYNKRNIFISSTKIIDNLTIDSLFIFRFDVSRWDIKYNADQEFLSYKMWSNSIGVEPPYKIRNKLNLDYDSRLSYAKLFSDENITDYYKGTNAFGIEKLIVKKDVNKYILLFKYFPQGLFKNQFKINATEAKTLKDNLSLLLFIKFKSPYTAMDIDYHTPTIDEPENITTYSYYLLGDIINLWIYNNDTGKIYKKLNIR